MPQKLLDQVVKEGKKQKIEPADDEEMKRTMSYMSLQLQALIARDLWEMSQYFSVFNESSDIVKKALQVVNNAKPTEQ